MILKILILISVMAHPIFSEKQKKFYYNPLHDYNILSGVTGSGKSFTAKARFYTEFCKAPKMSKMILSGNTLESLYDNVIVDLLEFDKDINWLSFKHIANSPRLVNNKTGTMAVCVGANTEKAQDRVQGKSVRLWYADEVVKQPKSFIEMALSRCRQIVNGKMEVAPIIWTCNPDTPSHHIKKDYIDNQDADVNNMYFGFYDNPTIDESYIKKLKKRFTGVFYERMIEGRWTLAEGVVYDKFNRAEHVKNNEWFESKRDIITEYCLGIDWGYSKMLSLLLYGFDHDGVAYGFDEICVAKQLINEELKDMMTDKGWFDLDIEDAVADCEAPNIFIPIIALEPLTGTPIVPFTTQFPLGTKILP